MKSLNPVLTHPALHLLGKCKTLYTLEQIHANIITTGLARHTYPLSRLLQSSSVLDITYTLEIFTHIPNPTIFLFNIVISSLINHRDLTHIAFSLYNRILLSRTSIKPNSFTYPSLFKACASQPWVRYGLALHNHVLKFLESEYDGYVQASLINYYANCGRLGVARYLFDQITDPDLPTWNSILSAYSRIDSDNGMVVDTFGTLVLFKEMQDSLVRPNEITLVALISACGNLGALSQGVWAHAYVVKNGLRLNHYIGTALIGMYSHCGCLELARQLFDQLPQRDRLCYNAMIGAFAIHGYGHRALDLYEKMKLEGLAPDNVTFVVTMSGCSHVGLVEKGCKIFESIKEVYGIEPTVEHYGCIVDLLSRAGRLREAEEKTLARLHLAPVRTRAKTGGNYVLLSNMYAGIDKWEDVKSMRKLMKHQGITKIPGTSLVEVGGAIHEFIMGDRTHPFLDDIHLKLEEISFSLQEYGHKPSTKEVLFDIEEEEKEEALLYHSERLAIAFALLMVDSNCPIRIIKNLRVCGDCHASTKLISKIYRREIVMRDRIRFHHFADGACSCKDYW
ncbi:hypothetical protein K2173_013174 [Erythroxylum novogranatense]|uniref:DYW domain-containing protein n=1 Tax=Erythroxylum novogranatense TaxID=1862640 RepID=A0AAV8TEU7_9ROSI|nr:hypothetical protein K2173_013174 [Erythroxylum novogranatense]